MVPIGDQLHGYLTTVECQSGPVVTYAGRAVAEIKTAFRRARTRAGLPPQVSPYCIRHTMAVWLREQAVPEWECAGILGHRLPGYATTEAYAKYRPDYLSAASSAIDLYMTEAGLLPAGRTRLRASCVLVPLRKMVGAAGIEPATPTMST